MNYIYLNVQLDEFWYMYTSIHCYAYGYPNILALFIGKIIHFPLNYEGIYLRQKKTVVHIHVVYFWTVYSISFFCLSVFVPVYLTVFVTATLQSLKTMYFVLQLCSFSVLLVMLGPLHFHMNFRISLTISIKQPAEFFLLGMHWMYRSIWGEQMS